MKKAHWGTGVSPALHRAIVIGASTALSVATLIVGSCATVLAGEIAGHTKPVDGDSFNIEIRIYGIDAPEKNQTCKDAKGTNYRCGEVAAKRMKELLNSKTVRCERKDQDTKYGRPVAICFVDGTDIGAVMVEEGLAVAYRKYSKKYVPNEQRARAGKRGLWSGTFEMPWHYRARVRKGTALRSATPPNCPPPPSDPSCKIKGNIGGKGGNRRLYHVPGSRSYEKTVISASKGERYFCSEEEAVACGWRKVRSGR
jgi:endonuclease YncB( thermonuclease family)